MAAKLTSTGVTFSDATEQTTAATGTLATKNAVGSPEITDNSVGAAELNVSGNGTSGQMLTSDGDGSFSWSDVLASSAINDVFWENSQSVTSSYTISTNKNALTAGPITINTSVTVTVPTGSNWTIV